MDFLELAQKRQSCRSYAPMPVEEDKLEKMAQAARLAPSACNSQPWKFYIVTNPEKCGQIALATQEDGLNKFTNNCPAFFIITEETALLIAKGGLEPNQKWAKFDLGIATISACLAAEEQGLGTCIMGSYNSEKIKEILQIQGDSPVAIVIAVGYPASAELRQKKRKSMEEIATFIR